MRDPDAQLGRRAWVGCPACADHEGCPACAERRLCERHWRFLLNAEGRHLFLQCPTCAHRWWQDTRFGAGARPVGATELPGFGQGDSQVA